MAKRWTIKDSNGNSIGIVANSKYEAKQQYLSMIKDAQITEIVDGGKVPQRTLLKIPLPGTKDEFKPVTTEVVERALGPNESCSCGSGRKYKKCCMRKDVEKRRSEKG